MGYVGIGIMLYIGIGMGMVLLFFGVGLDGVYMDYFFFVEFVYEVMMGNMFMIFMNFEFLGEYYVDIIFLDSRVFILDFDF